MKSTTRIRIRIRIRHDEIRNETERKRKEMRIETKPKVNKLKGRGAAIDGQACHGKPGRPWKALDFML